MGLGGDVPSTSDPVAREEWAAGGEGVPLGKEFDEAMEKMVAAGVAKPDRTAVAAYVAAGQKRRAAEARQDGGGGGAAAAAAAAGAAQPPFLQRLAAADAAAPKVDVDALFAAEDSSSDESDLDSDDDAEPVADEEGFSVPQTGPGIAKFQEESAAGRKAGQLGVKAQAYVQQVVRVTDDHKMTAAIHRNVLFLGRTRAGKSTVMQVLRDPLFVPTAFTFFSETRDPMVNTFAVTTEGGKRSAIITAADTPGLFEQVAEGGTARSNDELIKMIQDCAEQEFRSVNCVVLFISLSSGVLPEDVEAILEFAELFGYDPAVDTSVATEAAAQDADAAAAAAASSTAGNKQVKLILCVTRADSMTKVEKKRIQRQLYQHPQLAPLVDPQQAAQGVAPMKVMFMGAVDPKSAAYSTPRQLIKGYQNISRLRRKLIAEIIASEDKVDLHNLKVATKRAAEVVEKVQDMTRRLENLKDADLSAGLGDVCLQADEQRDDAKFVQDNHAFMAVGDFARVIARFVEAAKAFNEAQKLNKVPRQDRRAFFLPISVEVGDDEEQREDEAHDLAVSQRQEAERKAEEARERRREAAEAAAAQKAADEAAQRDANMKLAATQTTSLAAAAAAAATAAKAAPDDAAKQRSWEDAAQQWHVKALQWVDHAQACADAASPDNQPAALSAKDEAQKSVTAAKAAFDEASVAVGKADPGPAILQQQVAQDDADEARDDAEAEATEAALKK